MTIDPAAGCDATRLNAPAVPLVTLSQLASGERACFQHADLRCEDCDLLNALGLTDRCELKVCKAGDPWIVQVKSTRIGLSKALAQRIHVVRSGRA